MIFGKEALVAPPLMWSESRSVLHEALFRREVTRSQALRTLEALERAPVRVRMDRRVGQRAWELATQFGWAKTYDAEYLALAELINCRLVTLDARLRRATVGLGYVIGPTELRPAKR